MAQESVFSRRFCYEELGCCRDCKIRVVLVWECAAPEGLDLLLGVGFQG